MNFFRSDPDPVNNDGWILTKLDNDAKETGKLSIKELQRDKQTKRQTDKDIDTSKKKEKTKKGD